jgi:predicted phage gp36 major capsid-like protein
VLYTALYMSTATRTQVYLTAEQRRQIEELRAHDGRTLAEVVRTALDEYLASHASTAEEARRAEMQRAFDDSFGSVPDLEAPPREEWDRFDLDLNHIERDPPRH